MTVILIHMVGFVGMADQMYLVPVGPNPRWQLAAILKISNHNISGMGRPINFMFDSRCL